MNCKPFLLQVQMSKEMQLITLQSWL